MLKRKIGKDFVDVLIVPTFALHSKKMGALTNDSSYPFRVFKLGSK